MASGVPCVVTDVGDCAQIVGDTGRVVKAGDMRQFATEIIGLLLTICHSSETAWQTGTKAH